MFIMQVLASQLRFLANRNAELAVPPLFWPVNCIKIGGHIARVFISYSMVSISIKSFLIIFFLFLRLTHEMEIDESLVKNEMLLYHEYDEMEKGIADRDVYIIVLQMKLLAEKEEVEKLKTKMEELEHKSENMARDLRRVSQNYNQERLVGIEG